MLDTYTGCNENVAKRELQYSNFSDITSADIQGGQTSITDNREMQMSGLPQRETAAAVECTFTTKLAT